VTRSETLRRSEAWRTEIEIRPTVSFARDSKKRSWRFLICVDHTDCLLDLSARGPYLVALDPFRGGMALRLRLELARSIDSTTKNVITCARCLYIARETGKGKAPRAAPPGLRPVLMDSCRCLLRTTQRGPTGIVASRAELPVVVDNIVGAVRKEFESSVAILSNAWPAVHPTTRNVGETRPVASRTNLCVVEDRTAITDNKDFKPPVQISRNGRTAIRPPVAHAEPARPVA
jgi:hypothetical protein